MKNYEFRYVAHEWGDLPTGFILGDVGGVAVDRQDNVYVFNRSPHPMIVFDRSGRFLRSWGEGMFSRPHGLHIDAEGNLWCTDDGDHTVRKCTPDGQVLLQLGIPHVSSAYMSGQPFHRCTHTATARNGDVFVSDGYGNASIHRFSARGKLLFSWGAPGIGPGEFNIPHNLCCDEVDRIYVADRENHRIQVFDACGTFLADWHSVHRPCALCMNTGADPIFFVGEVGPGLPVNRRVPNLGPRISMLDGDGRVLGRFADEGPGTTLDRMIAPHGIAVDSRGDLYVGEVANAAWAEVFPGVPKPASLRTLRKFERMCDARDDA